MKIFLSLLSILIAAGSQVHAVNEAAVLFLLLQPSVRANGMAGTSVATSQHSPLSVSFNPGHLGFSTFEGSANLEFYPTKTNWFPEFNIKGLTLDAYAFIVGYDFRKLHQSLPISLGFAYTKVNLDLGQQVITGETGPKPISTFNAAENVEVWSVGVAIDYFIRAGVGLNFKEIVSNLGPIGAGEKNKSLQVDAHDFGILVQVPLVEIFSKPAQKPYTTGLSFQPFITPAFGFSRSNIGKEISYLDPSQRDPLPRVARMGISLHTGLIFQKDNVRLRALSFEWSSESEDLLVKRDESGQFTYETGVGEIDFMDNVLMSNANANVINSRGWQLSMLDIISIRRGRHKDPDGNVFYSASGYGINFINILRLLGLQNPELLANNFIDFAVKHVDIQYDHSSFDAGSNPLNNTTFHGLTIRLF